MEYLDGLDAPIADHDDILWPDNQAVFGILDQTMDTVLSRHRSAARSLPTSGGLLPS